MIFSVYFVTYRHCCWLLSHSMEMKICFFWMRREPDLELPSQNVISHSMDEGHDFESLSVLFRQQRQLLFSLINVLTTIYEPECLYVSCKTHVTPLTACRLFFSFFFYCCFLLILLLVFRLVFCFVDLSAREIRLKHT